LDQDAPADIGAPAPGARISAEIPESDSGSGPVAAVASSSLYINLDILGGMTESAKDGYRDCIAKYASALAREASRLEEAERAENLDKQEITTTMVVKADDLLRHPPSADATATISILAAQAVSFAAAIVTPIFGADLHSSWQWTVTITCGIIAVISQVYAIIAVRRR
jgi:hypothetical protein